MLEALRDLEPVLAAVLHGHKRPIGGIEESGGRHLAAGRCPAQRYGDRALLFAAPSGDTLPDPLADLGEQLSVRLRQDKGNSSPPSRATKSFRRTDASSARASAMSTWSPIV